MEKLESLLKEREIVAKFDHLNHRVRCYAHIINICSSHIINSTTSASGQFDDYDGETDGDFGYDRDIEDWEPALLYDDRADSSIKTWFGGLRRDPLKRARRLIHFFRSSDQRRTDFLKFIVEGNQKEWFYRINKDGKRELANVPAKEFLRDVKTRWDSVYKMLQRLRILRPVSSSQRLDVPQQTNQVFDKGRRSLLSHQSTEFL